MLSLFESIFKIKRKSSRLPTWSHSFYQRLPASNDFGPSLRERSADCLLWPCIFLNSLSTSFHKSISSNLSKACKRKLFSFCEESSTWVCVGDLGEVLNTPEINKLFRWFGYQKRKQVTKFNPLKILSMRGKKKKRKSYFPIRPCTRVVKTCNWLVRSLIDNAGPSGSFTQAVDT